MSSYKRKRSAAYGYGLGYSPSGKLRSGPIMPVAVFKKRTTSRRAFVEGRDRVGGFYGRYAGRGGETKFHDVALNDAVVAAGLNVTASVNLIAQGITESTRVGRKCTLKSFHWRYRVSIPEQNAAATPLQGDSVRVILYIDKQCNGAAAAGTDILEAASLHSFRNLANSGRFVFLCDKVHTLNYLTLTNTQDVDTYDQGEVAREFQLNKTLDMPIEFNSTTGVIAEIRSNNLGVLLVGNNGIGAFASNIRLRFTDY